jgi:hypothetical protein
VDSLCNMHAGSRKFMLTFLMKNVDGSDHQETLNINLSIILKLTLMKLVVKL